MNDEERELLHSIAAVMEVNRLELEATRHLLQGVIHTLKMQPQSRADLIRALTGVFDGSAIHALNTHLTEEQIQAQRALMKQLVGPDIAPLLPD